MARNTFEINLNYNPLTGKPYKRERKPIRSKIKKELLYQPRKCQYCRKLKAQHLHHIRGFAKGGSDRKSNLIALCAYCHQRVHSGEITTEQLKRRLGIKVIKNKKSTKRKVRRNRQYNPFALNIKPIKVPNPFRY
jgi:5-methylcytosine-specific restriction endonuclease McrA